LEKTCNHHPNSFAILNNIADEVLIKTAKDLDVQLASSEEGMAKQVTAIKAEETLRAALAEAAYQAHLDSLKHREWTRDEEGLDLNPFNNSSRVFPDRISSQPEAGNTKTGRQGSLGPQKRRKDEIYVLEY
jgi:hypothetical protein